MSNRQVELLCQLTRMHLRHTAQRQQEMAQRLLIQMIERIGLILMDVDALLEHITAIFLLLDTRIMARSQELSAQLQRLIEQQPELHIAVAGNARIRRPTLGIIGQEIINDILLKRFFKVNRIMRNADGLGHAARIVDACEAAAATVVAVKVAALL